MKHFIRVLSVLLATLMLLGTAACAQSGEKTESTKSEATDATLDSEAESQIDPAYVDDVPDDVDGKETVINIVTLQKEGVNDEMYAEKLNMEAVNDAVYERNVYTEERLNVKMNVKSMSDPCSTLSAAVKGGDDTVCDIVANSSHTSISQVQKGNFLNLTGDDSYIDTSKAYWSQGFNDIASYGTGNDAKQYLATGAMAISLFRYMFVTIYNKDDFNNKGIDDIYNMVLDGDWTLEEQEKILKDQHKSVSGDDAVLGKDDYYGFITGNCVSVDPYLVASKIKFVTKNEDGVWEYDGSSSNLERADRLQETLTRIYNADNGTYVFQSSANDDTGLTNIAEMFTKHQSLMATVQLYALETTIVNADFLYGIAPIPKLDVNQEYGSYTQDQVTSFGVAATVPAEGERYMLVTAFLEVASRYSYEKVVDAYYNRSLSYKYMQDPESVVMLDLIYKSIKFDFAGAFGGVLSYNIRDNFRTVLTAGTKKVSSTLASQEKSLKKSVSKFNTAMEKIRY